MKLAIFLLCAATGFAQLPPMQTATVSLTNTPGANSVNQLTTLVQFVAQLRDASFDATHNSFSLTGFEHQLGLAEWLLQAADKPPASNEYVTQPDIPGDSRVPITRIHYLQNSDARDIQEILTAVRVVGEIQFASGISQPAMMAFRGTAAQAQLGDWLATNLDVHAGKGYSSFALPPGEDGTTDIVRIFFLNAGTKPAKISEVTKNIRETTGTKSIFWKTAPPAIVMRGTSAVLSQAQQLIGQNQL